MLAVDQKVWVPCKLALADFRLGLVVELAAVAEEVVDWEVVDQTVLESYMAFLAPAVLDAAEIAVEEEEDVVV